MIEGLTVTITGTELATLCESRAAYHDARAAFYAAQKQALPDVDEHEFSNVSKRPQEMMQERIETHKGEAAELRFIAAHLKGQEEYQLAMSDLSKLGIVKRGY